MAGEPDPIQGVPQKFVQEDRWHKQEMEKLQAQIEHERQAREVMVRGQSVDAARNLATGYVNRLFNVTDVLKDAEAIANFVLNGTVPAKEPITETETHGTDE